MTTVPKDPSVRLAQWPFVNNKAPITGQGHVDATPPANLGVEPEPPITGMGQGKVGGEPYQPNVSDPI
jgi:hypothetical protein